MVCTLVGNEYQRTVWVNRGADRRHVPTINANILAMNRRSGERRSISECASRLDGVTLLLFLALASSPFIFLSAAIPRHCLPSWLSVKPKTSAQADYTWAGFHRVALDQSIR